MRISFSYNNLYLSFRYLYFSFPRFPSQNYCRGPFHIICISTDIFQFLIFMRHQDDIYHNIIWYIIWPVDDRTYILYIDYRAYISIISIDIYQIYYDINRIRIYKRIDLLEIIRHTNYIFYTSINLKNYVL